MANAIEVKTYYCRFCGLAVQQRARHEPRCKKNPLNLKKKERKEREWYDGKHPVSINLLDKDVLKIEVLVKRGEFQSKSQCIRDVLGYVLKHPELIQVILHEKKENV